MRIMGLFAPLDCTGRLSLMLNSLQTDKMILKVRSEIYDRFDRYRYEYRKWVRQFHAKPMYAAVNRARGLVTKLPIEQRREHYRKLAVLGNKLRPLVKNEQL